MKSIILLAALVALVAGAIATADNEHPTYKLLAKKNGYEIREYGASGKQFWAEATTNSSDYSAASNDGFQKLFKFITGKNSANLKINMTSPVTMHKSGNAWIMRFFVPSELGSNVPTPTDPNVRIVSVENDIVAVVGFGGWATQSRWTDNSQKLIGMLSRDGIQLSNGEANRLAQYDSPWTIFNRLNEVWLPVDM